MKIGLLECDHVMEQFRHIAGDYDEMFAALFNRHAPHVTLQPFDVCNGEFPASLNACDAFITTGSRYSAYDEIDWIQTLKDFVRQVREARKPFAGICFGHQVMAEALGGKVAKAPSGWGVGVHNVELIQHEDWMRPEQSNCRLQYMHQDQVVQLPADSVVLGRSDHCPVAVFKAGDSMLGIQAHPEFTSAYNQALILNRVERIGEAKSQAALSGINQKTDEAVVTQWIVEFLNQAGRQ